MTVVLLRCAAVWLGVSLAAIATGHVALAALDAPPSAAPAFAALVQGAAALALLGCAAWAWSVATLVILGAARQHLGRPMSGRLSGPPWAQRLLLTACGATLLGTTALAPAHATAPQAPVPAATSAEGARAVVGLPLPDRTAGPLRHERGEGSVRALGPVSAVGRTADAISRRTTHTVRPGDSLWSISEDLLGRAPATSEVADLVHHLYDANRAVIGPDPDLIRPGHQLRTLLEARPTR